VRERRLAGRERVGFILCRECLEPLVLDRSRIQRLGGRSFIQCEACKNFVWIRRGDMAHALEPEDVAGPPLGPEATA